MTDDPFEVLGISPDASPEEVEQAFKRAVKKTHPDAGGSAEEFVRVTNALAKIKDPDSDGKPDNRESAAYERVANFFINSINASINQGGFGAQLDLDQFDLVKGAREFFKQQIAGCNEQIAKTNRQVKQFDKAIKRLKSKKKDKSQLHTMLEHHKRQITRLIKANTTEIEIFTLSLQVLDDYTFEAGQPASNMFNPYQTFTFPWR